MFGLTEEQQAEVEAAFPASERAGELLLELARSKREYYEATGERMGEAVWALAAARDFLSEILGEEVFTTFYGDDLPPDSSRHDHLNLLANRLTRLSDLFGGTDQKAISSLRAASEELWAIAGGDAPRNFAQCGSNTRGRLINSRRLAVHQLRALAWEAYLKAAGNAAGEVHLALHTAYGVEWRTMARWSTPVIRELGQARYDEAMARSSRAGATGGWSAEIGGRIVSRENALARLSDHGTQYRAELARRVTVVGS